MKVSACLKGSPDSHGRYAVYVRISNHGHRSYSVIHPPIRVLPKQFKSGKVMDHPEKDLLNKKILQAIIETEIAGGFKKADTTFLKSYIEQTLKDFNATRAPETIRHYNSKFDHFLDFTGNIPLKSIDTLLLNRYKNHLVSTGITGNNLWSYLKYVRTLINKADREGFIDRNPFKGFEMPRYKDPPKRFLLKTEIDKLANLKKLPDELDFARTWFLIGCYTGLRYGDMARFDKKTHIKGGRITIYTSKTGEVVSLPLTGKRKELLEKIDFAPMHYSNVHYNRLLKELGSLAGIGSINSHMARHTAGTQLSEAGVRRDVVAKILGHTNLKTTSIYHKITPNTIDKELEKLD